MGSDARDMMGLPSAAPPKPNPPKAPKPKVRGPTGMSREVLDLNYEGAPPISIVAPKFKEKPKLPFKPRAWEETPFGSSARKDGLILKHWRRKGDAVTVGQLPVTPADSNAASEMDQDDKGPTIPDAHWAKYNVRVPRPQYSDEEYEAHLNSDDWSKEETDYLVDLAIDFDLRWIVISDRYDYQPQHTVKEGEDTMDVMPQVKSRTQEDLKARYYAVAAKAMSLHVGVQNMSAVEFEIHERMLKFSPTQETKRKAYVEQLLARTEEEKHEEEFLLKELSRIVINQEKLNNERKALYERLDAPKTTQNENYSTTMYQTSQGLTQLMQNMLSQNKQKDAQRKEKRQSGVPEEPDRHRTSQSDHNKRASVGGGGAQAAHQHRHLNPRDQVRYGVNYPVNERLVGGVTFRNERAVKAAQAKSSVQTTRISAALTELGVPVRLTMPTVRVVSEYERLIESVKGLLEVRKLREKVDGEVRVWKAQKMAAEARERGEEVEEKKEEEPKVEEDEEDNNDNNNQEEQTSKKEESENEDEEEEAGGQGEITQNQEDEDDGDNDEGETQAGELANDEEEVDAEANDDGDAGADEEEAEEEQDGNDDDGDAEALDDEANAEVAELEDDDDDEDADVEGEMGEENEDEVQEKGEEEEEEEAEEEEEEEDDDEEQEGSGVGDEPEGKDDDDEEEEEPNPEPTTRSTRKRSASVASGVSSKRQKK